MKLSLGKKSHKSFNPKDKLVRLVSEVEEHIDNLVLKNSGDIEQDDSDIDDEIWTINFWTLCLDM